ncbi:MAG: TonB-dependent receptor [Verrucomicrobia bacterium]|nr:TonB-dependent receptor [Verrucomicrobiota bacterium]
MMTSRSRSRPVVVATAFAAVLLAPAALAQSASAPVDARALARYDKNNNGRLDPDELAALQADQATAARTPTNAPGRTASPAREDMIELSPFEVREDNKGYYASNTMSGTRLNSKLEDLASSISVVTKQQMADFAMLDINDIFAFEANTEGTGTFTAFEVDRNGMVSDQVQNNPQGANRVRGIGAANISLGNFATSGRVPIDPIAIEGVEISRGPNSNLFGLGEGSGTVNLLPASANVNRQSTTAELRFDDWGGWRTSLDLNRPVIRDKLGLRLSGVYQHDAFVRKPSGFENRRFNAMIRATPFKDTTVRASYQAYRGVGTRATAVTPRDATSYWKSIGSPTWDPVTNTVTVNGVPTVTGATNPAGLGGQNFVDPILFVENGLQLWQIGRLPAVGATNGPNNVAGTNRMLETLPEPVRAGRPLYSTVPGVSDRSLYDYARVNLAAPNTIKDANDLSTVEIEQYVLNTQRNKLVFQFAWQREDADRYNRNMIGGTSATGASYYLYVDPNKNLLDGRPNPFFGKPYIGAGEPVQTMQPYERDSYRAQGFYALDFSEARGWTKWLGRHQVLGYYEERLTKTHSYRFRDAMISPDHPVYAPAGSTKANQSTTNGFTPSPTATRPYFHFYTGDTNGANVDYAPSGYSTGNYAFNWFDPLANAGAGRWVTDNVVLGTSGITEGTAGSSGVRNLIKTKGATLQSSLLDHRLVVTLGRRQDENRNKAQRPPVLKSNGYEFDYQAMDGWVPDAQFLNDGDPGWALRSGETTTVGYVAKPFRNLGFIEKQRSSGGAGAFAAGLLGNLTLFLNKSDSFRPETPAVGITLEELPNPSSTDKTYGLSVNLGNKFVLRANKYETKAINSRAGQSAIFAQRVGRVDFERFAGNNDAISLQRQARVWLTAQGLSGQALTDAIANVMKIPANMVSVYNNATLAETSDVVSKGEEYELNYNPNSHLTLRGTITRSEALDANLSPHIPAWIAQRLPIWETIIDPRTGTKWLDTGYNGDNPQVGSGTPRQFLINNVTTPLAITQATEGKKRPETREWNVRMSASYQLAGISENPYLKRTRVSGALRWESKGAIGYYGVPINGDYTVATQLDPNRPIWNRGHTYVDLGVSYLTRIYHDKWRVRYQLNVRNVQESSARLQKIGAYPDGRGHTFRIVDPRQFIFTATFDL